MENCEHETHHDDCCVCWFKQSTGQSYPNDIPLFMHKMTVLLMNKDWHSYCLDKALGIAKDKFEKHASLGLDKLLAKAVDTDKIRASIREARRTQKHGWVI